MSKVKNIHLITFRFIVVAILNVILPQYSSAAKRIGDLWYDLNISTHEASVCSQSRYVNPLEGENLIIPDEVEWDNEIYTVTEIESFAFSNIRLTGSITLPSKLKYIGQDAFGGHRMLTGELKLPESLEVIEKRAFSDCPGLTGDLIIPESITEIAPDAFERCGFNGTLHLPSSITSIGESAFYKCKFTGKITIPGNVKIIGHKAFYGVPAPELEISEGVEEIGGYAFSENHALADLYIPNSVTTIGAGSFMGCDNIKNIVFGDGVLDIGEQAFQGCELLQKLDIRSVQKIGDSAFCSCCGLDTVILPANLKYMSNFIFFNRNDEISSPDLIICHAPVPPEPWYSTDDIILVFNNYNSKLQVPAESVDLYKSTSGWKYFFSITAIGDDERKEVSDIILSSSDLQMSVNDCAMLTATILPEDASDKTITWTTSDKSVAEVDKNGLVTARTVGTANITATCGSVSATCKVTVNPVTASAVVLNVRDMTLLVGQSDKLTATVEPNNTTNPDITWRSDNEGIATVGYDGTVTAMAVGTANITATCGSVSATCKVTVVDRPKTPLEMLRKGNGNSCTFIATMSISDDDLIRQGCLFVFGYTDSQGATKVIANTPERYCHTTSDVYNNLQNDFWVFAYRHDENGKTSSSGRRHLDGTVDDDFDSVSIILQASSVTSIHKISVYTLNGIYIGESTENLQPGTYIVTTITNNTRSSQKIVIR